MLFCLIEWDGLVRVVVINGSARIDRGNTALVLESFLSGMKQAGASVELFYAKRLNVKPCTGELYCWHEKPSRCYIEDDMQILYPKLRQANILVLATPVYLPLPGEMQNIVNRLCPLIEPILELKNGRTRAKFHKDVNIRKIVLVSVCGWWEMGNFDLVEHLVKEICLKSNVKFVGSLLRPHGYLLSNKSIEVDEVINALEEIGFILVKEGSLPKDCSCRTNLDTFRTFKTGFW